MLIYVLNQGLGVVGVIDTFESFIWTRKYRDADSFELTVNASDGRAIRYLQKYRYIAREEVNTWPPTYTLGYIDSIQDNDDGEKETVIVSGYGAEGLFRKRLYPSWLSQEKLREIKTIPDLLKEVTTFGCRFEINNGGLFEPDLSTIPINYIQGDMESLLRYLMTRDERQYTYRLCLKYDVDEGDESGQVHPILYFICESEINILYPENILAASTDNFTDIRYSFSEEDTYSHIRVQVNPEFNVSVTEEKKTESGETERDENGDVVMETYNISYADLDEYNPPIYILDLTSESAETMESSFLARNEKLLLVDPVIKKGQKREYDLVGPPIRVNHPVGNCKYLDNGGQCMHLAAYSEMVDYWYIDREETLKAMEKAAKDLALLGTENFQGRMTTSDVKSRNNLILGSIVLVRDDKRKIDYYKRVEQIEESWDSSGHNYQPTLGEPLKNIYDLIENK